MKPRPKAPKVEQYIPRPDIDLVQVLQLSAPEANRTDRYLSWEELRYRRAPQPLDSEGWWVGLKLHRMQARQALPLKDRKGVAFSYTVTRMMQSLLHQIDMQGGGILHASNQNLLSETDRNRYLLTSLMDEAIMSSLLEGAAVTRAEAKELLRSNRSPLNTHERMVTNNYRTMQLLMSWKDAPLTRERILSLHRTMTEGTIPLEKSGALRTDADKVRIEASASGEIIHIPPSADTLPERLDALCAFANNEDGEYIHPVLRAIMLHFWLAYDHPFIDGNGRTARALFYWAMLKSGYWLFEYISISQEIYRHAKSYYNAFIHSEEDDNDLNYFLTDQLSTIHHSITSLMEYLERRSAEQTELNSRLKGRPEFNHRQKALLAEMLKNPDMRTSVTAHCREFNTVRQTARTDLAALVDAGMLLVHKQGNEFIYTPAANLKQLISG